MRRTQKRGRKREGFLASGAAREGQNKKEENQHLLRGEQKKEKKKGKSEQMEAESTQQSESEQKEKKSKKQKAKRSQGI